jgi:dephospho-CoA kinase
MMLIIGLTGSIGMGKSTAAARFAANGIAVFDADAKVHELYAGAIAPQIEAAFPGTTSKGKVDRSKLSKALLVSPDKFRILEAIVHPQVRAAERDFIHAEAAKGAPMVVLEVPLLFESGGNETVDVVVVVSASADVQRQRVLMRPDMTPEKLARLLLRQMPDAEKRAKADFVVDTSGTIDACNVQVDAIIVNIKHRPAHALARDWT